MPKSFNARSKESTGLLFIDSEVYNKEFPAGTTLAEIKSAMDIKGEVFIKSRYANSVEYKLKGSTYTFTVKFLF
ncbi:hypothetical protein XaC1_21 [Xanthomonas phage XaC1]|nr:hypothetical protein XaC1_21 [Xanthomonas phage XaC1]